MRVPTEPPALPLPSGVFRRNPDAQQHVDRAIEEGMMPNCFDGHFEFDPPSGTCRFVYIGGEEQTLYVVEKLYREDGSLRSVALRALVTKFEHAARRDVVRDSGQPTIRLRFAIMNTQDGLHLLVDARLARKALDVLRTLPTPQPPIEIRMGLAYPGSDATERPIALAPS